MSGVRKENEDLKREKEALTRENAGIVRETEEIQGEMIKMAKTIGECEGKMNVLQRELMESQQKNVLLETALSQANTDLTEIKLVLDSSETAHFGPVDVRGLAHILLSTVISSKGPIFRLFRLRRSKLPSNNRKIRSKNR